MSPGAIAHGGWHFTAFLIGTCLGSFLNVAILRLPENESVVAPASRCPVCRTPLAWQDNVPVLSWLALRGRCRTCGTPISPMYPLVELTFGLVAWLLWARFVPTPADLDLRHVAAFVLYLYFAWCLLLAAFTDLRANIIPEVASVYAVPVGILGAGVLQALGYDGWLDLGWSGATLGALVGGGFLGGTAWLWRRVFGGVGVAGGDVRLMAMIGAFVGPLPGAWVVLLLSSFLGAFFGILKVLWVRRSEFLPYGPALSVAAIAYALFGDEIVRRLLPGFRAFL